jgi:hypothetical protein
MAMKGCMILLILSFSLLACSNEEEREYCELVKYPANDYQCPSLEEARRKWLGMELGEGDTIIQFKSGPLKKPRSSSDLDCCYQVIVHDG